MAIATIDYRSNRVRANEAAGKLSSEGRREGPVEGAGGVSRGADGVWQPILYHQSYGRIGADLSHEGLGGDRRQAGEALQFQPGEAKVFEAHQLFWADGGAGRAGSAVDSGGVARGSTGQRRRGCAGQSRLSRGDEPYPGAGRNEEPAVHGRGFA